MSKPTQWMDGDAESLRERVKATIATKFAPAIDFKAPYAKVMLDAAADAVIAVFNVKSLLRSGYDE